MLINISLTLSSSKLVIITKRSNKSPFPGSPFGINICCGQPQPQKLNSSNSGVPAAGRFWSTFRKVRSNGTVKVDSVERRRMVF